MDTKLERECPLVFGMGSPLEMTFPGGLRPTAAATCFRGEEILQRKEGREESGRSCDELKAWCCRRGQWGPR